MPIPDSIKDNISIPVIGAPLFLISVPDLVIAQCKAGIIGSFPATMPIFFALFNNGAKDTT